MSVNKQFFIDSIREGALDGWRTHSILPSITIAQAILESGWGESDLAKKANNLFGIKASADWTGPTIDKKTWEVVNGKDVTEVAAFRVYDDPGESVKDHGAFFTSTPWREKNYTHVIGERDYSKAAQALRYAGYATDPDYAKKLISIIEDYNLADLDAVAMNEDNEKEALEAKIVSLTATLEEKVERIDALEAIIRSNNLRIDTLEGIIDSLSETVPEQPDEESFDEIERPKGYQRGGIETLEIIHLLLSLEEFRGYLKGNLIKYRERAGHKPDVPEEKDLAKALVYKRILDGLDSGEGLPDILARKNGGA